MSTRTWLCAGFLALMVQAVPSTPARAETVAVDAVLLQELQQIIQRQQEQLGAQAETIEALRSRVDQLEQKAAQTETIATEAQSTAEKAIDTAEKTSAGRRTGSSPQARRRSSSPSRDN